MAFGLYVHIPYCLQRCSYCDFATILWHQSLPPQKYYDLLTTELRLHRPAELSSVYFGGGTPSLVGPEFIRRLLEEIRNLGFQLGPQPEVTIEINPGTMDDPALSDYLRAGVNRFSVGAQTFQNS